MSRRRRHPAIFQPNPGRPRYLSMESAQSADSSPSSIRSATVQSFDAATWTATIQVTGSVASYLAGVPVAKNLNSQLLTAGARVGTIFFDDSNPTDAAIVTVYGAVPDAWITTGMIVDGTIATADMADLAVTTGKIADLAVTTGKLAALAVTTAKLDDLAVTTGKLAASAVTSAKIVDGTIVGADCSANVANGVATIDAGGDMNPPGDIFPAGALYPGGQASYYLDDMATGLYTNGNLELGGTMKATLHYTETGTTASLTYNTWNTLKTIDRVIGLWHVFAYYPGNQVFEASMFFTINNNSAQYRACYQNDGANMFLQLATNGDGHSTDVQVRQTVNNPNSYPVTWVLTRIG